MRRITSFRAADGECNSMTNEEKIWLAGHIESGELEDGTPWIAIPNRPDGHKWTADEIADALEYRGEQSGTHAGDE